MADYQFESGPKAVWVNRGGVCVGRFGRHGYEVMRDLHEIEPGEFTGPLIALPFVNETTAKEWGEWVRTMADFYPLAAKDWPPTLLPEWIEPPARPGSRPVVLD